MAFLDTLRQRNIMPGVPAGNTFGNEMYYGQPPINAGGISGGFGDTGPMDPFFENRMRNRDITDFAAKTRIAGDESIRQENIRRLFDPNSGLMTTLRPQNTVYQPSPSEMGAISPLDQAKLDLEKRKIDTVGGLDRAEFELKTKEYELDRLKNEQIYGTKNADMERKTADSEARLKLAYDKLQQDAGNAQNIAEYRDAQMRATQARMELMQQQHDAALTETKRMHDAQIKKYQDDLDLARNTETKTVIGEDGTERTVTVQKGQKPVKKGTAEGTVRVIAPDGQHGNWPANKPLPKGYVHIGE